MKEVEPGGTYTDALEAVNLTEAPLELELHAVDAELNADGAFASSANGVRDEAGGWISVEPAVVRVPPRGTTKVAVTIAVPPDVRPGDHLAAIAAQKRGPGEREGNVRIVSRVAVRAYLTVPGSGAPLAQDFRIDRFEWVGTGTAIRFEVDVVNTGDLIVEPAGHLSVVRSLGSEVLGQELPVVGGVPPKEKRSFTIQGMGELAGGSYSASLELRLLDADLVRTATTQFAVGDEEFDSGEGPNPLHRDRGVLIPVAIGLIILMLVLLLLFWLFTRRRRRDDEEETPDGSHRPKVGTGTS